MQGKPILSFFRSFLTSLGFWGRALWVYNRRLTRFIKKSCGCCCPSCGPCCCVRNRHQAHPHQPDNHQQPQEQHRANDDDVEQAKSQNENNNNENNNTEDEDMFETPWERLILFPEFRFATGTDTTKNVRQKLRKIFKSEKTIELIILWCRAHSRMDRLQRFGYHLSGLDPDSQAVKGHTFYLLESISKKLGGMGVSGKFERTTVASSSNSSLLKKSSNGERGVLANDARMTAAQSQEEAEQNQVFDHDTQMDEMVLDGEENDFAEAEEDEGDAGNNNPSQQRKITTTTASSFSSPSDEGFEDVPPND